MRQAGLSATVTHAENSADYYIEMDFWEKNGRGVRPGRSEND
jgi:hypothetical protein